jgi:hypothetical protein
MDSCFLRNDKRPFLVKRRIAIGSLSQELFLVTWCKKALVKMYCIPDACKGIVTMGKEVM